MNYTRITANLPASLENAVRLQVRTEHYPCETDLGLGVLIWDIYSRQKHTLTGPLMRLPLREVEEAAYALAEDLGMADKSTRNVKPYRFTMRVPEVLRPLVKLRMQEEEYRSASAYLTSLLFFSLKVKDAKKVPHHKTSLLLREPEFIRQWAFEKIAKNFGKPDRKWPKEFEGEIMKLIGSRNRPKAKVTVPDT